MPKLPRIRIPPPREWPQLSLFSSVRGRIIAGFSLLVLILVAVVVASAWLAREHRSDMAEVEQHHATAHLLQDAELNGSLVVLLLQRYIVSGDENEIPGIRANLATATDSLAEAQAQEEMRGDEEEIARLNEITAGAVFLSETAEEVIALRRGGDVQGASEVLEAAAPRIQQLGLDLDEASGFEHEEVAAHRSQAGRTADLIFWLLVVTGAIGATFGLAATVLVARSILRPLSSLEATALAVAGGNLKARAPATGPRELARLGASLNRMTESLLDASKRRELEAERERAYAQLEEAHEALAETSARLTSVLANVPEVIYSADYTTRTITFISKAIRRYGYEPANIVGKPGLWSQLIHRGDRRRVRAAFRQGLASGRPFTVEYRLRDSRGEYHAIRDSVQVKKDAAQEAMLIDGVMTDSSPDVLLIDGVMTDITELKQAEGKIRESEEKFRGLLESAPDAIVIVNDDGRIVLVNAQTEETFGYSRNELLGQRVEMLVPECFREAHVEHRTNYRSAPHTRPMGTGLELAARRKDGGEFPAAISLSPQKTKDGVLVTSIIRDITERKQAEEELRVLNRELEADRKAIEELNRSLEEKVRERTRELSIANEEMRERNRQLLDARAQAATDALTGLSNHRAFQERIREQVHRAQETSSPVGLIMLDIDGFKRFNDSLGHLAGDQILRELALTVVEVTKREDAYRYGGDEFAVLLPGVEPRKITGVAERLRRAVERRMNGNGEKITVSLGVASFPDMAASAEELIYGADAAMYWAKSAGKNRVADWSNLVKGRTKGTLPWYAADRNMKAPDAIAALLAALGAKDPVTSAHTERCSWYAGKLAEELGLAEEETSVVRLASLLHDIGKLAVPDAVLFKRGPLNDEEWAQMKQHPTAALHVLSQIRTISDATPAILHHHEHFDGSGYPDGLAGEDIPIASRILLVTDAFDAMTTDRPYRKAMPVEAAIEELRRNSGSQFDPAVIDAFLQVLSRHGPQPLHSKAAARGRPTAVAARGRPKGTRTP